MGALSPPNSKFPPTMPYKDKAEQNRYCLERIQRFRRKWLADNGPCRICGSWIDLEVDHVDPQTKVSHRVWSWAAERRNAELAKCQPLCHVCHKHKSDESLKKVAPPGMKWCHRCGFKPIGDFVKKSSNWDGLDNECRDCKKVRNYGHDHRDFAGVA